MNTTLAQILREGKNRKPPTASEKRASDQLSREYLKIRAAHIAKHGDIPSNSTDLLKMAGHHGTTAKTHHGPGGLKPKSMKVAKAPTVKSGLKKTAHVKGAVKTPRIAAPRPGKGTHNHPHLRALKRGVATGLVSGRVQHFNMAGMPKREKKV
jgi:hypothetical protein